MFKIPEIFFINFKIYEEKTYEKLWKLLDFSNDKILGISWYEINAEKIKKHLVGMGFIVEIVGKHIKFNNDFFKNQKISGYFLLLNNKIYCNIDFTSKNATGLIRFLEKKYGKFLNFRDDMIREFKYDWIVGDIMLSAELGKLIKMAGISFVKDIDFAKLHRGEIDITDFTKKYDEKIKLNQ